MMLDDIENATMNPVCTECQGKLSYLLTATDANRHEQIARDLHPVPSGYFSKLTVRPRYSVLSQDKLGRETKLDLPN